MDNLVPAAPTPDHGQVLVHSTNIPAALRWWAPHSDVPSARPAEEPREADGKTAFAGVVAFTFILLLSPQNWFPALAPFRIAFLAGGFATAALLWERFRHARPMGFTREVLTCLGLLAWAFLTLPLSYWPGGSVEVMTTLYVKALMVFWLLLNLVTSERRFRFMAKVLALCTVPLAFTAVKNYATGTFLGGPNSLEGRIVGYQAPLAANPNDLAFMLNLLMPLSVALFLGAEKTSTRILWLVVVGLNVVAVVVTFSRAGFLGLATVAIMYFAKLIRRPASDRTWAFAALLLAILLLPFLPSGYIDRIATITDVDADPTGSSQERWHDTVDAARFVMQHPIVGAGIGMDMIALNEVRGPRWKAVHNAYLQYAVDLGLPGLILFLFLFYRVFRAARCSRRRVAPMPALRNLFLFNEGLEVSLTVFAIAAFFHPVAYHFYFYYIAGLALAARTATDSASSATDFAGSATKADWEPGTQHIPGLLTLPR